MGSTKKESFVIANPDWLKLWWRWYNGLSPQQRAQHYWYQEMLDTKNTWKGKARIFHYSDEMREYPHIQEIIKDRQEVIVRRRNSKK